MFLPAVQHFSCCGQFVSSSMREAEGRYLRYNKPSTGEERSHDRLALGTSATLFISPTHPSTTAVPYPALITPSFRCVINFPPHFGSKLCHCCVGATSTTGISCDLSTPIQYLLLHASASLIMLCAPKHLLCCMSRPYPSWTCRSFYGFIILSS
jgi:hypothetical protein